MNDHTSACTLFTLVCSNLMEQKSMCSDVTMKCYRKACTPTSFPFPEDYQHHANIKGKQQNYGLYNQKKEAWEAASQHVFFLHTIRLQALTTVCT